MTSARSPQGWLILALVLLTGSCTPAPPTPPTPTSSSPSSSTPSPSAIRRVAKANLITAADIPKLPLGGTVRAYEKNARPVSKISVCQQDLAMLGATSSVHASYRQQASGEPTTPLTGQPTVYALALQLPSPAAAVQARETWKSWLDTCRYDIPPRTGFEAVERGFDWQRVQVPQGSAEVAEIAYRPRGSKSDSNYWESTGLTVVSDRMMVTVHLFYAAESLYNMDPNDDEGGYRHPQLKMAKAAATRLAG